MFFAQREKVHVTNQPSVSYGTFGRLTRIGLVSRKTSVNKDVKRLVQVASLDLHHLPRVHTRGGDGHL